MKTINNITLYHKKWGSEKEKHAFCASDGRITRYSSKGMSISAKGVCVLLNSYQLHVRWDSWKSWVECFSLNAVTGRYEWSENIKYEEYEGVMSSRKLRVGIMFCAYRRLTRLVGQIHTLLNQSHLPEKVFVAVKGYAEKDVRKHVKKHFVNDDRVIIKCTPNRHMLSNILDPVRGENIEDFDLIIKIDDDDMYPVDFIEKVVKDFAAGKKENHELGGITYNRSEAIRDHGRDVGQTIVPFSWSPGNILGYVMGLTPKALHWLFLYETDAKEALKQSMSPVRTGGNDDQFVCDSMKATGGMMLGRCIDGVVYNNVDSSILRNRTAYAGILKNHNMTTWTKSGKEEFFFVEGRLARVYNDSKLIWVDKRGSVRVPCKFLGGLLIIEGVRYVYDRVEAEYKKLNRSDEPSYKWGVCAVSLLRDSIYWIEDWIDYHIKMGASKIVLYDNSGSRCSRRGNVGAYAEGELQSNGISKKGEKYGEFTRYLSDEEIRKQVDAIATKYSEVVEIVTWKPYDSLCRTIVFDHIEAQDDCLERYRRGDIGWFAFMDVDEYLYCKPGITVESILREAYKKDHQVAVLRFEEKISQIRWGETGPCDITKLNKILFRSGDTVKNIVRLDRVGSTHLHYGYVLDEDSVSMLTDRDQFCIIHHKGTIEEMKGDGAELDIREIAGTERDESIKIEFN